MVIVEVLWVCVGFVSVVCSLHEVYEHLKGYCKHVRNSSNFP